MKTSNINKKTTIIKEINPNPTINKSIENRKKSQIKFEATEKRKEYIKKYHKSERYKEYIKKYQQSEKFKEAQKKYQQSEKFKEAQKKYQKTESYKLNKQTYKKTPIAKQQKIIDSNKRREAKNNCIHSFTREEWKQKCDAVNGVCQNCNKYIGTDKLTLDHIFPISKANEEFKLTGIKRVYTINDVQPLCRTCNSIKNNKITLITSNN
jgi:5-methylcytosine-specific restriction endonuclease McrA